MTLREREVEYEVQYQSATANGDADNSDLLVVETDKESQLSNIQIDGSDAQDFSVVIRDQDGSNASDIRRYFNVQNVNRGTFENPEAKWGSNQEVAIINRTALSADDYSINLTIHEHTGK